MIEKLTVQEAARLAKVSTRTVYRWIDTGQLPYENLSDSNRRLIRIRVQDFEKFCNERYNVVEYMPEDMSGKIIKLGEMRRA